MTDASGGQSFWNKWRDELRDRLQARRTPSEEQRTYRLANTVRLPFIVGIVVFIVTGVAVSMLVGRIDKEKLQVPDVVIEYQEAVTNEIAQSVRRGVNEGVTDLELFARTGMTALDPRSIDVGLQATSEIHGRYLALYVVGPGGKVLATTGEEPKPKFLGEEIFKGSGMLDAREVDDQPLIQQFTPVGGDAPIAVVGHYDPGFLRFSMESALPGSAWVVNRDGKILAGLAGSPFANLPRQVLRTAAARAAAGEAGVIRTGGSLSSQELVAYSPVTGAGPAGQVGWSIVTARQIKTSSLPQTEARRQALVAGVLVGLLGVGIMSWMWLVVLRPMLRLQKEAERLAFGDLSKPVEIIRYDEIGLAARALERIRVLLIRRRSEGDHGDRG